MLVLLQCFFQLTIDAHILDCHKSESWMVVVIYLISYFGNKYYSRFKLMHRVCF